MLNRYPLWKYLLVVAILVLSLVYSAANLYAPDPAIQISGASSALEMNTLTLGKVTKALKANDIEYFGETLTNKSILVRLRDKDQQLAAKETIKGVLRDNYVVALNMAPTTPHWLRNIGASPMKLGLDLSGGVHFLLEVNTDTVVSDRLKSIPAKLKERLRGENIRYRSVSVNQSGQIVGVFKTAELRDKASSVFRSELSQASHSLAAQYTYERTEEMGNFYIRVRMTEEAIREVEDYTVAQNLTTLRNRVNELGVSEPIVQRQGRKRIVVELPGVQDTAEAKRIIGKTANLEFRLEAKPRASSTSKEKFEYRDEDEQRATGGAYLERKVVINGTNVSSAQAGFGPESNLPEVNISLDSEGGAKMHRNTRGSNVGRRLGVLFIEYKTRTQDKKGRPLEKPVQIIEKKIISLATIQSALNAQFRITGLNSPAEASELALLLRAGALAAPMTFVQESTIGPSLGEENIKLGVISVQLGLALVFIFMLLYYRVFGFAANFALVFNLVLLVAIMSLLGATLTLPGIAGIVLTVGMAVDANVLIFSRIKEELKQGLSPQMAIDAGFNRAFTTILDANLTTLIVAVILYGIGTGPVKGFAITLAIGILTSMFTAIWGTRAVVNLVYGGRSVQKLWI
ncbi:protein-export membrane protein SecD [Candidatus Endobugula sertula]|uniref:Protein translocase subunit SecD n=1 Tax=Candidatus Endobugula sertula TaxID=62101 RepID=A0A1D2QNQ9_9GAMM|nr:protein-export membrane protein SecD [Candidatus Endobugula sertula]